MTYGSNRMSNTGRMPNQRVMPPSAQPPAEMATHDLPLAMAWFGYQVYGDVYSPEDALARGTLFPELDKPWMMEGGR